MAETNKSTGLAGVSAGETSISTVGKAGKGLEYRGYDIYDLAEHGTFEEISYLLLYNKLPNKRELGAYRRRLKDGRELSKKLRNVLEGIPGDASPMDVLRTGCSYLGCLEPEEDFKKQNQVAERLLSALPSMLLYWFRYHADGKRIRTKTDDDSIAGHFLKHLYGSAPDEVEQRCMDVSLILYAEHEFNASTFSARVCAATLSDFYSCITAAIGTLRGPLHGGANERAMELISRFKTPAAAEKGLRAALKKKERIMGFGHRVYKDSDPRSKVIKGWVERLSEDEEDKNTFAVAEAMEKVMAEEKGLFPNLDFYSAPTYHLLGVPNALFTPIFVLARTAGWSAHIMEQRANNRLIRPTADYIGPEEREWVPINKRS